MKMMYNFFISKLLILLIVFAVSLSYKNSAILAQEAVFAERAIDWAYKQKGYSPGFMSIMQSKYDLIVMDYSFYGGADAEIDSTLIENLQSEGECDRKIILAYMSIGVAEDSRFYFGTLPIDLFYEEPSPQSTGNLEIKFWDERWQKIIFGNSVEGETKSYLDRIIDAGFDGVCLNFGNALKFWGAKNSGGNGVRETVVGDMVDFVVKIADYARNKRDKPYFIVVPENGVEIIDAASYSFAEDPESEAKKQKQRYFDAINAIVAEDTFFSGDKENDNELNIQTKTVELLDAFSAAGKNVFAVDYLLDKNKIDIFYELAKEHGYIPYVTGRARDTLTVNENYGTICNETLTIPVSRIKTTTEVAVPTNQQYSDQLPIGKRFIVNCDTRFERRSEEIDVLPVMIGESAHCTLIINKELIGPEMSTVNISTILHPGSKISIKVDPENGKTNESGKIDFTIKSISPGIDWLAWGIADDNGKAEFNSETYDSGEAWGIFVEVRE